MIWAHLVFVLPYVFLSLADPWRAFDERYTRAALAPGRVALARCSGASSCRCCCARCCSPARWPLRSASGQYLPTLFAGAGRVATLTTEAVTLAAGADRRVIGIWALLQAALPLLVVLARPRPRRAGCSDRRGHGMNGPRCGCEGVRWRSPGAR